VWQEMAKNINCFAEKKLNYARHAETEPTLFYLFNLFFDEQKRNTNSSHNVLSFYSVEWLSITAMCDIATNLRLKRETEELFVTKNRKEKNTQVRLGPRPRGRLKCISLICCNT
jgi:hypothetical protein